MDIARPDLARKKRRRRLVVGVVVAVVIGGLTVAVSRLEPASPPVDGSTVWMDRVERGEMIRRVRGPGTLVPEKIRWISAANAGRVEGISVQPGTRVEPDTVLLELSNQELEQDALEAESAVRAAEAERANLEAELESQLLSQQAVAAGVTSELKQAELRLAADERLAREGLLSQLQLDLSRLRVEELTGREKLERSRVVRFREAADAQVAAQQARLDQLGALYRLRRRQVDSLKVEAGISGVLQEIAVEVGQRVSPGTTLARVADPTRLKAELRIPETQAKDVQVGLPAEIDTRNGVVGGEVIRVDPAVQEGTVTVDVALHGDLPKGARPELSVDGTITIERLPDVLHTGRPAYGQPGSTVSLFRITPDGEAAERVSVRLGRSSVNTVEIVEGLEEGDQVILSDTSRWDEHDRIRLE